jgi:uncharacterized protein
MQLSAFAVLVRDFPEPGYALAYNAATGASTVLAPEDAAELAATDLSSRSPGDLSPERRLVADRLLDPDVGILVDSPEAEEAEFRDWYASVRSDKRVLSLTVSTSFACNFACTYCYQDAYLDGQVMTIETADALAAWCAERIRASGAEHLSFNILGGEPLLHPELVAHLAASAQAAARAAGATFAFRLITNGYFLTPAVVDRLAPLGLKALQVTLDGDETTHGMTRPAKKGANEFRRIWENLVAVAGRVEITLAGNYTDKTVDGFPRLLERLRQEGLTAEDITKIAWKPALMGADSPKGGACGTSWAEAGGNHLLRLTDAVKASGFVPSPILDIGPCGIHQENTFAADPHGRLFECPGFVGHPEWAIGGVRDGIDLVRRARVRPDAPLSSCGGCSWRTRCAGGCLAIEWVARGKAEGVNCEAAYFEAVAPGALPRQWIEETLEGEERAAALARLIGKEHVRGGRVVRLPVIG